MGGQAGEGLSPSDVVTFASGYGAWVREQAPQKPRPTVVVGRDARISGPWVRDVVCGTLNALGIRRARLRPKHMGHARPDQTVKDLVGWHASNLRCESTPPANHLQDVTSAGANTLSTASSAMSMSASEVYLENEKRMLARLGS